MADLFSKIVRPGTGNAAFLCDLADNVPCQVMRQRARQGAYPDLRPEFAQGWRKMFGRTSTQGDL